VSTFNVLYYIFSFNNCYLNYFFSLMEEERFKKQIEKEKDAEIASLKIMVQSLQRQLAAAKNVPEPSGSAVSQEDVPEPTAGAMEQPPTSNNVKIRK